MKAVTKEMTLGRLRDKYHIITYPEFQREPSVWGIRQKRLLIDSILRGFDIGNIYIVADEGDYDWQCVDGQQRLNAIFSFLGVNLFDRDNEFQFIPSNEVYEDGLFKDVTNCKFSDPEFNTWREQLLEIPVRIIFLTHVEESWQLNLQFQRLQIAQILNGAEKLNAMVGEMRDRIFGEEGLGKHSYFQKIGVRNARFGGQQTAAQVVQNAVSWKSEKQFARARFMDMQVLFKKHSKLTGEIRAILQAVGKAADELVEDVSHELPIIKNRALAVSVLLFRYIHDQEETYDDDSYKLLGDFLRDLNDQMNKVGQQRLKIDHDRDLSPYEKLQLAITQASVEKKAIHDRHSILTDLFNEYLTQGRLTREEEYAE